MTTPTSTREPLYIEIAEQRKYTVSHFIANYVTLAFLFASMFFATKVPLTVYVGIAVAVLAVTIIGYRTVSLTRPLVKKKLSAEFNQQTGLTLPETFNPQALPKGAFSEKIFVTDQSGSTVEWKAARNGAFFRFAPAS